MSLAKNTAYLTIASIGQKIVAFVYFALIARIVGAEWTGTYFLALSVTTMVGVIADFGLTPVLVRETAKERHEQQSLLSEVLGLKAVFYCLAIIAAYLIMEAFGHDAVTRQLIMLALVVMGLDSLHLTYYGLFRGRHNLSFEAVGIVIGQVVTLVIGVSSLLIAPNLSVLILALLGGSLWNVLFSGYRLTRIGLKPWRLTWSHSRAKQLLKAALPFALAAIFVKVYSTVDALLLEHYLGAAAVGIYSIAYKLTYAFQFLPLAFVAALYPTFSKLIASNERKRLQETFERATWYMLLLAVPIVFGLWSTAHALIPLVYSETYSAAVLPLKTLIFVLLFIFLDFPIGALLNADDRQATKTAIMGGTMLINIVLNSVLIPELGVLGATLAALGAFSFLYGAGVVAIRKSITLRWSVLARQSWPILLAGGVMTVAVLTLNTVLPIILTIPLGGLLYVGVLFATKALSLAELRQLRQGIRT